AVRLDVEVRGEITQHDVKVLELSTLKGVFEDVVAETVSYVNAPLFARARDVEVRFMTSSESPDHRNLVTVRGTLASGEEVSVSGTLAGNRNRPKIVAIGDYDVDLDITDHMAFLRYEDMPGVIGTVGRVLGEAGVNIAGMQVARATEGGEALVALTIDSEVAPHLIAEIAGEIGATSARFVSLA
ncbi:ACT domain-containing protein, partial [Streptomyces sp. PTM05]